jgi:hypothetical protein
VNPNLYKLWSRNFFIKASSTQSYPATSPLFLRRGFIHNNVKVAPRQSGFMFTYNKNFDSRGKNLDYWISLYQGGSLYEILLYNQVI